MFDDAVTEGSEKPEGRTKVSQEKGWQKVRKKIEALVRDRPDDHLSSLMAELREIEIGRANPVDFYAKRKVIRPLAENLFESEKRQFNEGFYYPDMKVGKYVVGSISPIRYLMKCVRPDTQAIVELGSGWSANLFQLYIGLGHARTRKIRFHGAEYTKEGQAAANLLAQHDGQMLYRSHNCDYRAPNIGYLRPYKKHILVYTRHSIEQVDYINPELYDMLRALEAKVTLVHIEPVGWQRRADLMQRRLANDTDFFNAIGTSIAEDPAAIYSPVENAAWWSWRLNYNINLLGVADDYCARGLARQIRREYEFAVPANVFNPSTLVHLELW